MKPMIETWVFVRPSFYRSPVHMGSWSAHYRGETGVAIPIRLMVCRAVEKITHEQYPR